MSEKIKTVISEIFDVAKRVVEAKEVISVDRETKKIEQLVHRELLNFFLYLSASDGSIEVKEALFILDFLGEQLSPEEMCKKIEEDNIYSASFEQKIPLMLKKLVKYDNAKYAADGKLDVSLAMKYICLYENIGNEFIACDHEVAQSERDDLNTYISNMRSFFRANYQGPEEAIENGTKVEFKNISTGRNQKGKKQINKSESEESLEELLEELNSLIGMNTVKATVNQLIHFNAIKKIRDDRGLNRLPMTMHMVFYGNPGTGKTTVARLIAKIYHQLGLLSKGHLVEVDRSGLVAGYVGHTALKVNEVIEKAKGGVLFIDEAYALTYKRSENDFGWEAVDTLIKAMEDNRDDLVVIVAGYPERMEQFIESNPGLKSRFNRYISFTDYEPVELLEIFKKMLMEAGFTTNEEVTDYAEEYFEEQCMTKGKNFANARMVRNFMESAIFNQSDRLFDSINGNVSDEELCKIVLQDVEKIA